MTGYLYDCQLRDDAVRVRRRTGHEKINVCFKRTVRVPDNSDTSQLPPDLGNFPLYKVQDYADSLSPEMVAKGGVFLPMYQREAMWISFTANSPFAVKVYVGCVNAISGETAAEDASTKARRQLRRAQGKLIQDYVTVPGQRWLDGIASGNGVVKQFVATRPGEGYTVEAQVTGHEVHGGLQVEITPAVVGPSGSIRVSVALLTGKKYDVCVPLDSTFGYLKKMMYKIMGMPTATQKLIYRGAQMLDDHLIASSGLCEWGRAVVLMEILRGGGWAEPPTAKPETKEMGLAAGGKIKQVIVYDDRPAEMWHKTATVAFNVQILNASAFESVTGLPPPETPITMETYAELGLPFFKLYEEDLGDVVHGPLDNVKSIGEMDGVEDPSFAVPIKPLNDDPDLARGKSKSKSQQADADGVKADDDISNPAGPLSDFRPRAGLLRDCWASQGHAY
ncbi:hypothetical protein AYO20_10926 [Fonsecaea nubica]|uniref:Ubiquitin-like domain-containing protein n=1 Tax=Fonsecaea nubica TaxID=856822 RepID=A0A178C4N0_9EURO|nr:hypothetical protein AYO20_10926 [Fonsecaea nubica]OAL23721.1 hypothetical protein AYO20_10926 [Fonsecaea nubica]